MSIPNFHLKRRAVGLAGLAAIAVGLLPAVAQAQAFPSKPLTIVVPFPAGGTTDILARIIGQYMSIDLGQPVVIDNRAGAGGNIGSQAVARAPADGYTLLITTSTSHIVNPMLQPKLTYDPAKDFQPLARLAAGSVVLLARADAPFNTLDEFKAYAGQQNAGLSYGSWGIGSSAHLYGELLRAKYNVPLVHVPYRGDVLSTQDLVGGTLPVTFAGGVTARTLIDAGRAKALGQTAPQRFSALPDVPTFAEQGYDGFDLLGWAGIFAPSGLSPDLAARIAADLQAVVASPEVAKRLSEMGQDALFEGPEAFSRSLESDFRRWGELVRTTGVQGQ